MSQMQSFGNAPAASLVGSLGVFTLADVLTLLADSTQSGELQVVGPGVDGRVWLEEGELSNAHVGSASTIGQAVFELACVPEGWFYFTSGLASSSGQPRVPVRAVLEEVKSQVHEWHELRELVPFDSIVSLSPNPPSGDVQLRADQWRMVTSVGNAGHSVKAVLDTIDGDQISGLRILRDLHLAGLITLQGAASGDGHDDTSTPYGSNGFQSTSFVRAASQFTTPDDIAPDRHLTHIMSDVPSLSDFHIETSAQASGDANFRGNHGNDPAASLAEVAIIAPSTATDVRTSDPGV